MFGKRALRRILLLRRMEWQEGGELCTVRTFMCSTNKPVKIKPSRMGVACGTRGRDETRTKLSFENLKGKDHLKSLDVDGSNYSTKIVLEGNGVGRYRLDV
jgi:hypothetical protein